MKYLVSTNIKYLFLFLVFLFNFEQKCFSQLLLEEDFNYPAGSLLNGQGGWLANFSPGNNPMQITPYGLSYPGYPGANEGNAVSFDSIGEDNGRVFPTQISGSVFASFLVSIGKASTVGEYFFHYYMAPFDGHTYTGKVFVKSDSTNKLAFGISKYHNPTTNYSGYDYFLNTTYLIVIEYKFVDGGTKNDSVKLWINPNIQNNVEPTPTIFDYDTTAGLSDIANIGAVALRQGNYSLAVPDVTIDGIRVGQTWESITKYYPRISINYPNGGETIYKQVPDTIRWVSNDYIENVQILLYKDGKFFRALSYDEPNTGIYPFKPACEIPTGSNYKILVAASSNGSPYDFSDSCFQISNISSNNFKSVISEDPCAGNFSLKFPLKGCSPNEIQNNDGPFTHDIISIFDHKRTRNLIPDSDGMIISFVGDTAVAVSPADVCDENAYRGRNGLDFKIKMPNYVGIEKCESNKTQVKYLSYDGHNGYDYKADIGTSLYITAPGRVKIIPNDLYNTLEIDHENGYRSRYLHNDIILVQDGTYINDYNKEIARTGATGAPNNPHLHFTVWYGDFVVDPYRWTPEGADPWPHKNSALGNINLWENSGAPYYLKAMRYGSSIRLSWIHDLKVCGGFVDKFIVNKYVNGITCNVIEVPVNYCGLYFNYYDLDVSSGNQYEYSVRAHFSNGSISETSNRFKILYDPAPVCTQTLYSQVSSSTSFNIPVPGLYNIHLSRDPQHGYISQSIAKKLQSVDSIGFYLKWEIIDSSGIKFDKSSNNVGSDIFTDTSESFVISFDQNQTGLWNLLLSGTENIPIGDSLVVTSKIDTTTSPVYTVNNDLLYIAGTPVFTNAKDSVTITNIGNFPLYINWQYEGASQLAVANDSSTIPPSGFASIPICFYPSDFNEVTGKVILTHNGITSPDTVHIIGKGGPEMFQKYYYYDKWNMVSLPMKFEDSRKTVIYPSSSSNAFAYENTYRSQDTLNEGIGYWLKFAAPESLGLIGIPMYLDTMVLSTGWNLIGSISEPVPTTSLMSVPARIVTSDFYGYNSGYKIADTIQPGKAYWVKVNQAGSLILSSSTVMNATERIKIVPTSEMPPSPPSDEIETEQLPITYALEQCYPNPFNPVTNIKYQLPSHSKVTLKVYNLLGQEVKTLADELQPGGFKQVEWNSTNSSGTVVASGLYFYRLEATSVADPSKSFTQVKKMVLLK